MPDQPEFEVSKSGVKIRRLGPLGTIVVVASLAEVAITATAMWVGTKLAWDLWGGFSFMAAAIIVYPLVVLIARALSQGQSQKRE